MTNFDETKTVDAETLWNTPIPPVRWIVPDLLPVGLSILAGASKAGKSWLCLWLCLQVARGGQVWGRQVSPQPVLYLCLEDTFNRIQSRLLQIDAEGGSPNLLFQTRSGGIGQGLEAELTAALKHHPGIGLVVIDTLQKVRSIDPSGGAYAADYRDMSALKQLADAHHICILLVHHLRKQGAEDPFAQISGSTGLMGAADTIWLLQRQRMSPTARLQVTGRDVESRALTLEFNDCVWDLLEETTDRQQAEWAIPAWLWQAADFLAGQAAWQGTASQLLAAAGIDGVQPNQFTRSLVQHYHQVFASRGLRFASRRTANARLLTFTRDDDDGDDGTVAGSPGVGGIPKTPSSSSSPSFWAQDGNEHGLCVATGQPFAGNDSKTRLSAEGEQVLLVTGLHCRAGQAWADMRAVQRRFGKTGGTVALHAYQSFRPGEVTPRQCHDIGVELARRVWGSRFQVLVATHQNTNCLHNHFVINSVSYVDGKKYEQRRSQYAELRAASDEICRKYRLSVLEQPGGKTSRTLYQAERRGDPTRYAQMRAAIRYAMRETSTEADFAAVLRERGFVWQHAPRRKYPTLRPVDGGRAVRIYRLGTDFDWPAICRALDENYDRYGPRFYAHRHDPRYTLQLPVAYRSLRRARCRGRWPTLWERTRRQSGLWRLYMYYCYQLGIYPKRPAPRVSWPEIRAIWRDIERKLDELHFVTDHGFADLGAVRAYRQQTVERVEVLTKQRDTCAQALRRKVPPPDAQAKRDELTRQLAELRREVRLCDRVIGRVTRTRTCREQLRLQTQREWEQAQARRARYRGRER